MKRAELQKANRSKKPRESVNVSEVPAHQKIKCGRTVGYPITVVQGTTSHDAILLNCNDNPEEYLNQFTDGNAKVKIRWLHAGYTDHVDASSVRVKNVYATLPTRRAAANSGLLLRDCEEVDMGRTNEQGDPLISSYGTKTIGIQTVGSASGPVLSNIIVKTEDVHTDNEASASIYTETAVKSEDDDATVGSEYVKSLAVRSSDILKSSPRLSNATVKKEEIDTDDETDTADELLTPIEVHPDSSELPPVLSNMDIAVKIEEIDTDDERLDD